MFLDLLVYILIGCVSYKYVAPIFSECGLPKLNKDERLVIYGILWPIPIFIGSAVVIATTINKVIDKEQYINKMIDEERYVVKNKLVKIKRRKWF